MIGEQKLSKLSKEIEIEILGVKFKAQMYKSEGSEILTLEPQGNWSLSCSASSAKEISIFKRRK
jgi:hypothetical protein